jgi:hypothetical protein
MQNGAVIRKFGFLLFSALSRCPVCGYAATEPAAADWKAGVASVVITPDENMRLGAC